MSDDGKMFTEWGVQNAHGVHECDDEEHAREWQQFLDTPNWIVYRIVIRTASAWKSLGEAS